MEEGKAWVPEEDLVGLRGRRGGAQCGQSGMVVGKEQVGAHKNIQTHTHTKISASEPYNFWLYSINRFQLGVQKLFCATVQYSLKELSLLIHLWV